MTAGTERVAGVSAVTPPSSLPGLTDGRNAEPAVGPGNWTPLRDATRAEWTKLRTLSGTFWLLAAVVLATVALGLLASATVSCPAVGCKADPARVSLTGVEFGQAPVAVLAVLAVGGEYATGMVRVTFAAMPRRLTVLAAKTIVVATSVLAAGTVAVGGSLVAGLLMLPGRGFTAAHGFTAFSLAHGGLIRAAVGSVLYLVLIAVLAVGITAVVRDSAVAVGTVLGLLYLFPIVIAVVGDEKWHRRLQQVGPMNAGLSIQNTVGLAGQPLSPWAGFGVLACWAAGALLLGGVALRTRDA
jgi:ABC-2 type transport system permease protein